MFGEIKRHATHFCVLEPLPRSRRARAAWRRLCRRAGKALANDDTLCGMIAGFAAIVLAFQLIRAGLEVLGWLR